MPELQDEQQDKKPTQSGRLGIGRLFSYGIAEMPFNMAAVPVGLFIPAFYAQDKGLDMAMVGFILMIARFWDVFTDPLIGYVSDRTRTLIGRRKPWIIASVPLVMIAVYKLFLPSGEVSGLYLLFWIMVLWLGWTLFNIPYYAWGAELSPDYEERTRITGWRTVLGLFGTLTAMFVPAMCQLFFGFGGRAGESLYIIGIIALIATPLGVSILVRFVPERQDFVPAELHIIQGLKIMWSNAPFRRLIFAFVFSTLASALTAPIFVMLISHVIKEPTATPLILLAYYGANMAGIPFWVWLAERTDKHVTWLISISMMGLIFPTFMFLGEGDLIFTAVLFFSLGLAGGNLFVIPSSMKADVIDLDRLESGEDRAGLFFAAWSTATKMVSALGVGITLPVLAYLGFDPTVENGPDQLFALQAYYAFAPVVFYLLAGTLVIGYPITRQRHQEIRASLAAGE